MIKDINQTKSSTKIVSLLGGPCAGKSSSAAYLYYQLKVLGENVELVREYAKDWIYDGRSMSKFDQLYFLGKQIRQESFLYGKVNWIITDAPIINNFYYAEKYCPPNIAAGVKEATLSFYREAKKDGHEHVHIFLNRNKPYLTYGRFQTEEEAKLIDQEIKSMLIKLDIPFIETTSDEEDLDQLLTKIKHQGGN